MVQKKKKTFILGSDLQVAFVRHKVRHLKGLFVYCLIGGVNVYQGWKVKFAGETNISVSICNIPRCANCMTNQMELNVIKI